jgi:hypothetical protein
LFVRCLTSSLVCLAFAATLHASVPAVHQAKFNQNGTSVRLDDSQFRQNLALTAAPADRYSFYAEFYSDSLPAKTPRKAGLLHWFTSAVKRTAQKVNFFN